MFLDQCVTVFMVIFASLHYNASMVFAEKKIVKLIVPSKVKFVHHTHVLLLRPSVRKQKIRHEVYEEDEDGPRYASSHPKEERLRHKSRIHYIPYYAESKDVNYRLPLNEESRNLKDRFMRMNTSVQPSLTGVRILQELPEEEEWPVRQKRPIISEAYAYEPSNYEADEFGNYDSNEENWKSAMILPYSERPRKHNIFYSSIDETWPQSTSSEQLKKYENYSERFRSVPGPRSRFREDSSNSRRHFLSVNQGINDWNHGTWVVD